MEKLLVTPEGVSIDAAMTRLQAVRSVTANQTIKVAFMDSAPDYAIGTLDTYWAKYFPQIDRANPGDWEETISREWNEAKKIQTTFQAFPEDAALREAVFDQAIHFWGAFANITIQKVENPALADVRIGLSGNDSINFAPGAQPGRPSLGDIYLDASLANNLPGLLGAPALRTLAHEFGHVLGLSHPSNRQDGPLPGEYDRLQYSVSGYESPTLSGFLPVTPMLFDALGLEKMGLLKTNITTESGTKHQIETTGTGKLFIDNGGSDDVIDASTTTTDNEIDLRATDFNAGKAYFSSIGMSDIKKYNVAIYQGSEIENAVGGRAKDHITGNDAANRLNGGDGDNATDILQGGKGEDTYVFKNSFGNDVLSDSDGNGKIEINGAVAGLGVAQK